MKSNVDLYLNADRTKVVTAGPDAAFVLVRAGKNVPDGEISRLGTGLLAQARELGKSDEAEAEPEPEQAEEKQVEAPAEDKAVKAPAENKARGKAPEKAED